MTLDVPGDVAGADGARPTRLMPVSQLVRLSLYWLGLSAIFGGLGDILSGRIQFQGLAPKGSEGAALFLVSVAGAVVAILVQPTVGSISDYTMTRWGRRKPYIFIGSILDAIFLVGIASSNALLAIAAFLVLLQFSSNFAQGPFQGYVPDLVPAPQVGLASALVGLFQVLGNVTGFGIGALAIASGNYFVGTVALGALELVTMLGVVIHVDEGDRVKPRNGRSWSEIAREAWGADILRERSFVWLVSSRLFILVGSATLIQLQTFYLAQSHGLNNQETGRVQLIVLAIIAIASVASVIPSARVSDRVGRKPVIYVSCVLGAIGMAIIALSPQLVTAYVGAACVGLAGGIFLAVDWALMTDIIPKASSGRYMGISNVATASSGILALAIGAGLVMDPINSAFGYGTGPRVAIGLGVAWFAIGALLLRPVDEHRREDVPAAASPGPAVPTTEPA